MSHSTLANNKKKIINSFAKNFRQSCICIDNELSLGFNNEEDKKIIKEKNEDERMKKNCVVFVEFMRKQEGEKITMNF